MRFVDISICPTFKTLGKLKCRENDFLCRYFCDSYNLCGSNVCDATSVGPHSEKIIWNMKTLLKVFFLQLPWRNKESNLIKKKLLFGSLWKLRSDTANVSSASDSASPVPTRQPDLARRGAFPLQANPPARWLHAKTPFVLLSDVTGRVVRGGGEREVLCYVYFHGTFKPFQRCVDHGSRLQKAPYFTPQEGEKINHNFSQHCNKFLSSSYT